jgi:hypothetical protein
VSNAKVWYFTLDERFVPKFSTIMSMVNALREYPNQGHEISRSEVRFVGIVRPPRSHRTYQNVKRRVLDFST